MKTMFTDQIRLHSYSKQYDVTISDFYYISSILFYISVVDSIYHCVFVSNLRFNKHNFKKRKKNRLLTKVVGLLVLL